MTTADKITAALKRHAYAAVALPLGLLHVLAVPLGQARTVGGWQRRMAHRLLAPPGAETAGSPAWRTLIGLPVNVVAFALVVPAWGVFVARGVLYPAFGADNLDQSWGGPTLAGAWFAHFIQGPPLLVAVSLLLAPISRIQSRLFARPTSS